MCSTVWEAIFPLKVPSSNNDDVDAIYVTIGLCNVHTVKRMNRMIFAHTYYTYTSRRGML